MKLLNPHTHTHTFLLIFVLNDLELLNFFNFRSNIKIQANDVTKKKDNLTDTFLVLCRYNKICFLLSYIFIYGIKLIKFSKLWNKKF